jgi:hypothetical protein
MLALPDDFIALRYRRLPAALLNPSIIAAAAIMAYRRSSTEKSVYENIMPSSARRYAVYDASAQRRGTRASARNGIYVCIFFAASPDDVLQFAAARSIITPPSELRQPLFEAERFILRHVFADAVQPGTHAA